jgi:hypothetical protein
VVVVVVVAVVVVLVLFLVFVHVVLVVLVVLIVFVVVLTHGIDETYICFDEAPFGPTGCVGDGQRKILCFAFATKKQTMMVSWLTLMRCPKTCHW